MKITAQKLPTPPHLAGLTEYVCEMADEITFRLRCPCGCGRFRLERSCLSAPEAAEVAAWEEASDREMKGCFIRQRKDEKGQMVMMRKRGLFGKWEPLQDHLPPAPYYVDVRELRGACEGCGKVHTLLDSRHHGDDACLGEFTEEALRWQHGWEAIPMPEDVQELQVTLWYSSDEDEMAEYFPSGTDYANVFADFTLDAVSVKGRRTKLFNWYDE